MVFISKMSISIDKIRPYFFVATLSAVSKKTSTFDEVQRADWLKITAAARFLVSILRIWEKHKTTRYKPDDPEEEQQLVNHQKEISATISEQISSSKN